MENGNQIKELIKDIAVLKADRKTSNQVHERLDDAITRLTDISAGIKSSEAPIKVIKINEAFIFLDRLNPICVHPLTINIDHKIWVPPKIACRLPNPFRKV